MNEPISRRTMLRGLGTAIALPWLDSLMPRSAWAATGQKLAKGQPPLRMAFMYVPNGVHMPDWTPETVGALDNLPPILQALTPVKDRVLVLSGLTHDKARSNGDGAGDHARSSACFLTGCQPRKTAGADIKAGVSVDQIAAAMLGKATKLPSLELGCDRGAQAGSCDSGYSCAYSSNISWKSESTPMAKEINPKLVFDRLFGYGSATTEQEFLRQQYRKSVLDFVLDDANRLRKQLGGTDQRKLDEYLTSVRELEARIERAGQESIEQQRELPEIEVPDEVPKDYSEHLTLMYDLLALAFQADVTRVATFLIANEGSNRTYPFIGVPDGHHYLSHHGNDAEKLAKISKINRFHMAHFGRFLVKLSQIPEGDGTVLDNSMIVYGSCIGDGNRHNHDNLPVVLAGGGGGMLKGGRHLEYEKNTPMANLFLTMLDRVGVEADHVGDSTGRLSLS